MRDTGFCHLGRVRIEDIIILEVIRSLVFCYSGHHESTERTVLYIFMNGLINGYSSATSD